MLDSVVRDRLLEIARVEMADRRPIPERPRGHFFHHGRRTAAIALRLLERVGDSGLGIDPTVLFTAGLFHDIAKGDEPHHETGAERVVELLTGSFEAKQLTAIAELIRTHNQRRRPDLPLADHILQDADLLDHHGAQVVWLAIHWAAAAGDSPWKCVDYYFGEAHRLYLDRSRKSLNLRVSREIYDRRRRFGDEYFRRLRTELEGEL